MVNKRKHIPVSLWEGKELLIPPPPKKKHKCVYNGKCESCYKEEPCGIQNKPTRTPKVQGTIPRGRDNGAVV